MLFDELQSQLKALLPDLETIKNFWALSDFEKEASSLQLITEQEDFWQKKNQAETLKELQRVKTLVDQYHSIMKQYDHLHELLDMFKDDEGELKNIVPDIQVLRKAIVNFKITLLLNDPQDSANVFLSINSGAGGTESQDWSEMLLRMYIRFAEREGFNVSILDYQSGEGAGIKSATLFIKGKNTYGLLKGEQGIHRLVRISPFDAAKRRHTSFAAVFVLPETPAVDITINPADLRIDTYRAGGAGGQHVNKTESAVRITHMPSGIVVQCQSERSQAQNKETALKMLKAKLAQKAKEEQEANLASIEKKSIEWGSQIRSYVLHPYKLVKDHRTDFESPQPDLVLDGDLMDFIEHYLVWLGTQKKT